MTGAGFGPNGWNPAETAPRTTRTHHSMSTVFTRACLITALSAFGTEAFISAQQLAAPAQAAQAAARELVTIRITAEDAVRLAAENNLGIQIERYNPQIQEVSVSQ